jgi:hypothetical protein
MNRDITVIAGEFRQRSDLCLIRPTLGLKRSGLPDHPHGDPDQATAYAGQGNDRGKDVCCIGRAPASPRDILKTS